MPLALARYHARVERMLELIDATLSRGREAEQAYERFSRTHALAPGCGEEALRSEPGPEGRRRVNARLLDLQKAAYDRLLLPQLSPATAPGPTVSSPLSATAPRALSSRSRI